MKKLIIVFMAVLAVLTASAAGKKPAPKEAEPFTVTKAFERMPSSTLDLLTPSMRLDLVDYYRADSIYRVPNALEGLSYLLRPLTENYLKVQITPVTTLTLKLLPRKKGGKIVAAVYTIGDSLQSSDSDLRFYDQRLQELKRSKFIPDIKVEDFFNFGKMPKKQKKEMLELVPFPTVEYNLSPDNYTLTAKHTAEGFLSNEAFEKLKPYLIPMLQYAWNGSKYKLVKNPGL